MNLRPPQEGGSVFATKDPNYLALFQVVNADSSQLSLVVMLFFLTWAFAVSTFLLLLTSRSIMLASAPTFMAYPCLMGSTGQGALHFEALCLIIDEMVILTLPAMFIISF